MGKRRASDRANNTNRFFRHNDKSIGVGFRIPHCTDFHGFVILSIEKPTLFILKAMNRFVFHSRINRLILVRLGSLKIRKLD